MGKIASTTRIILLLLLSILIIPYPYRVIHGSSYFTFIDSIWGSVDEPRNVYPGSRDVNLYILFRSDYPYEIRSIVGILSLPDGFTGPSGESTIRSVAVVNINGSTTYRVRPGDIFSLGYRVSIDASIPPGEHYGSLTLNYTVVNSTTGEVATYTYDAGDIPLYVSRFPDFSFDIERIWWTMGGLEVYPTPGSNGLTLHVALRLIGDYGVEDLLSILELEYPFTPSESTVFHGDVERGSIFEIVFNNIGVSYDAEPLTYYQGLRLKYVFRGYGDAVREYESLVILPLRVREPYDTGLRLIEVSWLNIDRVYPGARGVYLSIILENMGQYTLTDIIASLNLPDGFSDEFGLKTINTTISGAYGYGDFIRIDLGPIYISSRVEPGIHLGNMTINALASSGGGSLLLRSIHPIPLIVNEYSTVFSIMRGNWRYQAEYAVAYPGALGIGLELIFSYLGEEDIYGLTPDILLPEGFTIRGISNPPDVIQPSSTFTLIFTMDIGGGVEPGIYNITINLTYTVDVGGQDSIQSVGLEHVIIVSDPRDIDTDLRILDVSWGINEPIYVYPSSENNPLRIILVNNGPYDARNIYIRINLPDGLYVRMDYWLVADVLPPLTSVESIIYINISRVDPGSYVIGFDVVYEIPIYGSIISKSRFIMDEVIIDAYPIDGSLIDIVRYGWLNNYKVYPGTENAILNLVIENNAPYPVSSITIYPELPSGIELSYGVEKIYIPGPIPAWQTSSIDVSLDISGGARPGLYNIPLRIEFLLESGGDGVWVSVVDELPLMIEELVGLTVIGYRWIGPSPGPGSTPANLVIIVRNDVFYSMTGIFASITLPDGIVSTDTGLNRVNVTPYITSLMSDISRILSGEAIDLTIIEAMLTDGDTDAGLGDYLVIPLSLNIGLDVAPDTYNITIELDFIDEWLSMRRLRLNIDITIPGRVDYPLILEDESRIYVGRRETNVSIVIYNPGTAPMYDVYVGIQSLAMSVAFSSSVKHFDVIYPGMRVLAVWRATVSPMEVYIGGIPSIIYLRYSDPNGYIHEFNQTVVLFIEGLTRLKVVDILIDPAKPLVGERLSISGTIINIGDVKARNVEVYLRGVGIEADIDSYTYIGDIDVGLQVPFTVYAKTTQSGIIELILEVRYSNIYNEEDVIELRYRIDIAEYRGEDVEGGIRVESIMGGYGLIITGLIGGFLVIASILIYRLYRSVGGSR